MGWGHKIFFLNTKNAFFFRSVAFVLAATVYFSRYGRLLEIGIKDIDSRKIENDRLAVHRWPICQRLTSDNRENLNT